MDREQYKRDQAALATLLLRQQKTAQITGYEAADAAGRSQAWWSKVVNRKLMPDYESVARFLEAIEADDDVVSAVEALFARLDVAPGPNKDAVYVHKVGSDRWLEVLRRLDVARAITVVNPSRLPVELRSPAGPLQCASLERASLEAEKWRGMGRKYEVRHMPASPRRQYVFVISEAAILSVFGLGAEASVEQLQHLRRAAQHPHVAIGVVPLCAPVVVPSPLVIADSSVLLAYAPGGVVISDDAQRPYEHASQALQVARAHAVSQALLTAWLGELIEGGRPLLLSSQR